MAWTTEIKSKIIVDGLLKVLVSFSDGTQTFTEKYETKNPEPTWLEDSIAMTIKSLKTTISFADTLAIGGYDVKEITPVVLTSEEIYKKKLQKFRILKNMIDLEIISSTDAEYIKLKTYLVNNFNSDYIY